jgi:hypothetical protein
LRDSEKQAPVGPGPAKRHRPSTKWLQCLADSISSTSFCSTRSAKTRLVNDLTRLKLKLLFSTLTLSRHLLRIWRPTTTYDASGYIRRLRAVGNMLIRCIAVPIGETVAPPVAPTPPRDKDHGTKRKETLRTLLDALQELSKDDTGPDKGTCSYLAGSVCVAELFIVKGAFEDDRDVRTCSHEVCRVRRSEASPTATVDEHLQRVGAEQFYRFQRCDMTMKSAV